ncbi:insulin receptor substrate 2-B isoform X3 [Homalodisca vitripennis]|uniref:insulin receptor substrate 2-B isoform X3 n=1 Tax=Homalodisca vitripennis TaxID=197043 RepID=UPI001EEAE02B|nr:insulin receptor substrate 2-B isoform X3 [Homalodisca vitripennis]
MKMSVRSWPSLGGGDSSSKDSMKPLPPDVVKCGILKKYHTRYKDCNERKILRFSKELLFMHLPVDEITLKKKFFVLRGDSIEASARLEYYDSEKKFRSGQPAKRSITLKTCFNINKRSDMRYKLMIALYTKNDCFCIVLETEAELDEWLKALLCLQQGEDIPDGVEARPNFEHVWEVDVQGKELGYVRNILGPYMLCLTDTDLTLVKKDDSQRYKILLRNIRCCGHLHSFVYLELGSAASIGPGNLWMLTEDSNIAQNVHAATLSAMTNCAKKDKDIIMPKSRNRSSSANEASRPIAVIQRWPTHAEGSLPSHKGESSVATSPASVTDSSHSACGPGGGNHQRTYSFPLSPLPPSRRASTGTRPNITAPTPQKSATHSLTGVRDRCDSLPGRARTTSEGPHHHPAPRHLAPAHRPHSMYTRGISYSPPVGSSPVSPASGACSMTDSAGSSLSMDGDGDHWAVEGELRYGHSLTPEEPVIMEENLDDYAAWPAGTGEDEKLNNYMSMERSLCLPIHNNSSLTNLRKYSHSLTGVKQSSPSQGSFMDVYSPCGSSPLEASGAYMPMSPGDTRVLYNRQPQSANHSRGSSLAEEGYVPMAPGSQDAYVDMDHGSQSARKIGDVSSGSSCSLTSGTPSNDLRFSEYNLERVSSLISQDDGPSERPARAYSVGSRPVNINNTTANRNEAVAQSEPQRVRAFSVGSTVPRARGVHPHLTTPTRQSSHSSVEPSEDLMELDFSKNKSRTRNKNIFKKPTTSVSSERLTLPSSAVSSAASSYSTAEGSYMEMSPRSSPKPSDLDVDVTHLAPSPPKNSRFSSIIGRSPPKTSYPFERKIGFLSSSPPINPTSSPLYRVPEADSGYVDMTTGSRDDLNIEEPTFNNLSSSPCASSLSTASSAATVTYNPISCARQNSPLRNDEYLEMRPGGEAKPVLPKSSQPRVETFPINETRPHQFIKINPTPAIKQPLLTSQNLIRARGSLQEDYLDMSLKRKKSLIEDNNNTKIVAGRTEPVDTPKKAPEGYVEMSWSGNKSQRKPSLEGGKGEAENYMNMSGANCNKRDRRGSRKDRNRYSSQPIAIQTSNKEGQTSSPFSGRKHSTGTPPKIPCYLPLNSFGSSSPSSSPYSSLGRTRGRKTARRDSKESMTGSGVTTPSGSTTTIFPLNLNSPGSPMKPFTAKQEYELSMCPVDASSGTVKLAQPQDTQTSAKPVIVDQSENEYVNFAPGSTSEVPPATVETAQVDARKPSVERLVTDLSNLSLAGVEDTVNTRLSEPTASEVSSESVATTSNAGKSSEPVVVSRTSSVSSVGEKEIQYASLDLVRSSSEDDSGQARSLKSQTSLTESSSTSTPSPNVAADKTFTYAEIDFAASQKLLRH